jgi:hypothetical protein
LDRVRVDSGGQQEGDAAAAELVACDSVLLAETKDHANWEIICECAKSANGASADALKAACKQVEEQEDEHLYHTQGWGRELRLQALGLKAVLPPLEEKAGCKVRFRSAESQEEPLTDFLRTRISRSRCVSRSDELRRCVDCRPGTAHRSPSRTT